MTARDQAAFNSGLRHAAEMALISALTLELRKDANAVRQQGAVAALRGLAEGLKEMARPEPRQAGAGEEA